MIPFVYNELVQLHKCADQAAIHSNLTSFNPGISFDNPWNHQKIKGFLKFLGVMEKDQWYEMG